MSDDGTKLEREIAEAEDRAWVALSRYKFLLFGYWASVWVHLNRLRDVPSNNPFIDLVRQARSHLAQSRRLDRIGAELQSRRRTSA